VEAALIGATGRTTLGTTALTIGRRSDNALVVQDAKASSRHAEIRPTGQGYSIVDLGSTNGTFVNEQRLAPNVPHMLNSNDVIRIGDTRFTYDAQEYAATVFEAPQNNPANPGYLPTVAAAPPSYPDYNPINSSPAYPSYEQNPAYNPTMAAPSPFTSYQSGQPQQQSPYEQQPPQYYPPYGQYEQSPYGQAAVPPAPAAPFPAPAPGKPSAASLLEKFKSDNRYRLSAIGAAVVLLVIIIVLVVRAGASTPNGTLQQYCNDFKAGDFNSAYDLLSSNLQSQVSRSQYISIEQPGIQRAGGVTSCSVTNVSESDPSATGTIVYTFGDGRTITANYTLVDQNGTWKVSNENVPTQ
jgi:hypothetical protein